MEIEKLSLTDFRNQSSLSLSFCPGINFLCGANARGKTNILESIYYFATTSSFRTSKDTLCIKDGKSTATVSMDYNRNYGSVNLKMVLDSIQKKSFFVNGEKMHSPARVLGNFCAVLFSPDELKIAKGGPEERRNFLDQAISELSGTYYSLIQKFEKILFARNLLLKRHADDTQLDVYDSLFADLAAKILRQREAFVQKLLPHAIEASFFLSNKKEKLSLKYNSAFLGADAKERLLNALGASRLKDRELGYTSIGPQRDDLEITINGLDTKTHASQGQQRTAVLSLKLATYEVIKESLGEPPVLLLDDVFSELDNTRAKLLFERVKDGQTIITGTRARTANFSYHKIKL